MIRRIAILAFTATMLVSTAHAEVREVDQDELRSAVQAGEGIGLGTILKVVAQHIDGESVDVRVFNADGLIYHILMMLPNGKMAYVFINAETGAFISPRSSRAAEVQALAKKTKGNNGKGKGASKSKGKGKGNN